MPPFTTLLLQWHSIHQRDLPWKKTRDPYIIWLSEIILQQTRVEQGLPYFEKLLTAFPNVFALASAAEDELMRLWEGLGYYSRARNLHKTAQYIAEQCNGQFPNTYENLLQLKGVGHYTAAAIASFAFGLPHAVVDGNVFRVLSRIFGIDTPIDSTIGKQQFAQLANELLPANRAADFNQAMMDFGATQCTPKPNCSVCSLQGICVAFEQQSIGQLPVKAKKLEKKERFFHYLVINMPNKQVFINKRLATDIWQHLYEFPCIEQEMLANTMTILQQAEAMTNLKLQLQYTSKPYTQQLTHRKVSAIFCVVKCEVLSDMLPPEWLLVDWSILSQYAFPKIITHFLADQQQFSLQSSLF